MATGRILFTAVFSALTLNAAFADNSAENKKEEKKESRLTFGGYGEAAYSRNFFSDNYLRYTDAKNYTGESHGRFDLPHVVKGWSLGSEIEFEHGGTESAVEIEEEEAGEYESEIERGGEVALEQFWIQKSFCKEFNIKMGHIIVPWEEQTNIICQPNSSVSIVRKVKTPSCLVHGTKQESVFGDRQENGDTRPCYCPDLIPTVSTV